jgi:hypothetical protein
MGDSLVKFGGLNQRLAFACLQDSRMNQIPQCVHRVLIENFRVPIGVNDLQELRDKFNIYEASAVVACVPNIAGSRVRPRRSWHGPAEV